MPWSIFTDGGGKPVARGWADALLNQIGAPVTPGNEQLVYDWEVSEGGGGKFNPLNQGPVPGHPELTSTGSQYGGGAADFVSWQAGIDGAADYLNMSNFSKIRDDLQHNNPAQARADIIASPWAASHYGGGSGFSSEALPGQANAIPVTSGSGSSTVTNAQDTGIKLFPDIKSWFDIPGGQTVNDWFQRGGLIILGGLLILLGIYMLAGKQALTIAGYGSPQQVSGSLLRMQRNRHAAERERAAETRRGQRGQRSQADEARAERTIAVRERRQDLAERVESRRRGEGE